MPKLFCPAQPYASAGESLQAASRLGGRQNFMKKVHNSIITRLQFQVNVLIVRIRMLTGG